MRGTYWCPTCREERGEPVTCAPARCYCSHPECPAYASYINPREQQVAPVTVRKSTDTSWATREESTWIDKM